jgi:hypothetical protein
VVSTGKFWKAICGLTKYSFFINRSGGVVRSEDVSGSWIDVYEAQAIVDAAEDELAELRASNAALLDALKSIIHFTDEDSGNLDSPNHCHEIRGVWDLDNHPEIAGKPCAECAAWNQARTLIAAAENDTKET